MNSRKERTMSKRRPTGFIILDRKGEYIKDTIDQKGNTVLGLHNHPKAPERMIVVSTRDEFADMKRSGRIYDYLRPIFSIRAIDPTELADFLTGMTAPQADLIRDYAYIPD